MVRWKRTVATREPPCLCCRRKPWQKRASSSRQRGKDTARRYIISILIAGLALILHAFSIVRKDLFLRDAAIDAVPNVKMAHHLIPQSTTLPGRFPQLGSSEFRQQCSWTAMPASSYKNCTVYMTPRSDGNEVSYYPDERLIQLVIQINHS